MDRVREVIAEVLGDAAPLAFEDLGPQERRIVERDAVAAGVTPEEHYSSALKRAADRKAAKDEAAEIVEAIRNRR
jgi:hypothetical protein